MRSPSVSTSFAASGLSVAPRRASSSAGCPSSYIQTARKALATYAQSPANDLLLRAARGEKTERTPVWLFRQAGRHLPEYNQYKKDTGKNFLQLLDDPKDVAEVTMQPLRRYDVDAAILFSDILVVPEALDIQVEMPGGKGIMVTNPLQGPADVEKLDTSNPAQLVKDRLPHVLAALPEIKASLKKENRDVPLIGFSAAPFTLMFYMVGGNTRYNETMGEQWFEKHPEACDLLLSKLSDVIVEYMSQQVEQGADLLQVFEAMGSYISEPNFNKFEMKHLKNIATKLKERHPDVPLMVFARGAQYANRGLQEAGYDVVTLDTEADRKSEVAGLEAEKSKAPIGRRVSLQGNFDPKFLQEGTPETVRSEVQQMLQDLGQQNLIANLGEGLSGKEDPALVKAFVDAVHEFSEQMNHATAETAAAAAA
uniref:Uroporphyrinogen decarboxylase n=1 Tax=Lotharella globosa TaxID=91324 RepID=A0A7S3Z3L1_9EUKA